MKTNIQKKRETEIVQKLRLAQKQQGFPRDFCDIQVTLVVNISLNTAFFTNSKYQVVMLNGAKLESWYYLPSTKTHGFARDLYAEFQLGRVDRCDYALLSEILKANNLLAEAGEICND